MKVITLLALLFLSVLGNAQKLEKLWSTPSELKMPESALFSEEYNTVFVSCIGEERMEKTGDGYIAQINLDGEITNNKWVAGLNAPKGMAIFEGKLYVSDLNELVIINIKKAKIEKRILIETATFLNDVSACKNGMVFVSDSRSEANSIYLYHNGELNVWQNNEDLLKVNGLWAENGKLYAGNQSVWEIDIKTKEYKQLFDKAMGIDGLEKLENGNFIFSNWVGRIFVSKDGEVVNLLDRSEKRHNTADIDFIPEKGTVLVPTFFSNSVEAYKLVW